ncbi:hypothetical protein LSM04_003232 [Trypanosoma melophagium]|uniref:uncharacterized protein n=1 Tax=Trypanosoma melophagium TaxID=715481 RepID=UPI00351A5704|nr:hypothetical protein LSM04_003232 [Trypanosoma melophagium]
MDSLAGKSSHYLHNINSSSSGVGSTASKVTLIDSLASSDDTQKSDFKSQKNLIPPQHCNQIAASPPRETEPCIVYLRLCNSILEKETSGISTDSQFIHKMFDSALRVFNNDGSGSGDGSGELAPPYKYLLHDSIEEVSSLVSVEEKGPLNVNMAKARALTLYRSSGALLDAYWHLKRTVQQRIYRCYYVKWTRFLMRRYLLSASTQTLTEETPDNFGLVEPSFKGDVPTTQRGDLFPPPHLGTSPTRNSIDSSQYLTRSNSLYYQEGKYDPPQPLSPSATESTFVGINNNNNNNNNNNSNDTDENDIIKRTTPLLHPRIRSGSKPCILFDYGKQSLPPNHGVAQIHDLPSTKLPKLITFAEYITVLSSTSVYLNPSLLLDRK